MYRNIFAYPGINKKNPDTIKSVSSGIPPDFVISRDYNNNVISVYENDTWDFSPYGNRNCKLHFGNFIRGKPTDLDLILISESKAIMFLLINDTESKHRKCKPGTFHSILSALRKIVILCQRLNTTISDAVNNKKFQDALKHSILSAANFQKKASRPILQLFKGIKSIHDRNKDSRSLLPSLIVCNEYYSDVIKMLKKNVSIGDNSSYATPLIPSRIFANILDGLDKSVERINSHIDEIVSFFKDAFSPDVGIYMFSDTHQTLKSKHERIINLHGPHVFKNLEEINKSKLLTREQTLKNMGYMNYSLITQMIFITFSHSSE